MARRIITTEAMEEDKAVERSLRPKMLADYIGQVIIDNFQLQDMRTTENNLWSRSPVYKALKKEETENGDSAS